MIVALTIVLAVACLILAVCVIILIKHNKSDAELTQAATKSTETIENDNQHSTMNNENIESDSHDNSTNSEPGNFGYTTREELLKSRMDNNDFLKKFVSERINLDELILFEKYYKSGTLQKYDLLYGTKRDLLDEQYQPFYSYFILQTTDSREVDDIIRYYVNVVTFFIFMGFVIIDEMIENLDSDAPFIEGTISDEELILIKEKAPDVVKNDIIIFLSMCSSALIRAMRSVEFSKCYNLAYKEIQMTPNGPEQIANLTINRNTFEYQIQSKVLQAVVLYTKNLLDDPDMDFNKKIMMSALVSMQVFDIGMPMRFISVIGNFIIFHAAYHLARLEFMVDGIEIPTSST